MSGKYQLFNKEELLDSLNGSQKIFAELIEVLRQDWQLQLGHLEEDISSQSRKELATIFHRLASSVLSVYARDLGAYFRELEGQAMHSKENLVGNDFSWPKKQDLQKKLDDLLRELVLAQKTLLLKSESKN